MRCPETVSPMSSWHLSLSYHHLRIKLFFMAVTISLIPFVKLPEVFSSLMTSPALLGKGLALGLVSTFFPFVSYTLGLRQMEAGKASVLAFSEPMVAAVAGIVVFGEMLRVENVLGILLIFTALVVLNSRNVKR